MKKNIRKLSAAILILICSLSFLNASATPAPPVSTENRVIEYCPLKYPLGPWYNPCDDCNGYFELYRNGVIVNTSNNGGCIYYLLDNTSEMRCYDVIMGIRILKKIITFDIVAKPITTTYAPDITITAPCNGDAWFTPGCSAPYNSFELTGSGGFNMSGNLNTTWLISLSPGVYTLTCYDETNCVKQITNVTVVRAYTETNCTITLPACDRLEDEEYLASLMQNCPECADVVANGTGSYMWKHISYDATTSLMVLERTYYDDVNCRKCTVTFNINHNVPRIELATNGEPRCGTLHASQLPPCMQGKSLSLYQEGFPQLGLGIPPGGDITLCCDDNLGPHQNPTYHLYADDDPCCYIRILLVCVPFEPNTESDGNTISKDAGLYRIVPNPASSQFRIASNEDLPYDKIEIRDISGKVLLSQVNADKNTLFDISDFDKGIYFIRISRGQETIVLKLVRVNN